MDRFWYALGDTNRIVLEIRTVFDQSLLPPSLQTRLLENTSVPDQDTSQLFETWMEEHVTEMKKMEVMENTFVGKPKNVVAIPSSIADDDNASYITSSRFRWITSCPYNW